MARDNGIQTGQLYISSISFILFEYAYIEAFRVTFSLNRKQETDFLHAAVSTTVVPVQSINKNEIPRRSPCFTTFWPLKVGTLHERKIYSVQIRDVGRFLAEFNPWTNTFGNRLVRSHCLRIHPSFFLYILPGARFRALSAGAHCTLRVAG